MLNWRYTYQSLGHRRLIVVDISLFLDSAEDLRGFPGHILFTVKEVNTVLVIVIGRSLITFTHFRRLVNFQCESPIIQPRF